MSLKVNKKCFQRYLKSVLTGYGDGLELNDFWFKCVVAKAIIFKSLDREITRSEWYKSAKGLKAQTVAYTVAATAQAFRLGSMQIDLMRIWREQCVPAALMTWMLDRARRVHEVLNRPPGEVKNPSEFAKKEFCWTLHVLPMISCPPVAVADCGILLQDFGQDRGQGRREEGRSRELDFDITLAQLVPRATEVRQLAENRRLLSDNNSRALDKLMAGRLTLSKAEKNALKMLLERLEIK